MAITSLRALLFTAGGVVAVGGAAYLSGAFDRLSNPPAPAQVAAAAPAEPAPPAVASGTQSRVPAAEIATTPAAPSAMAPQNPDTKPAAAANIAPAAPGVVAPTFDVVRVQGDGSVVIAGKAAPNSRIEIVHGSVVLGNTTAGADGSFAIVLDDPLKPGDYQIVLRSTAPGNVVATSEQTAVVSVPEKAGGQVLAMVEEPGKPAELLTVPKPEEKAQTPAPSAAPAVAAAPAATPVLPAKPEPAAAETSAPATSTPAETSAPMPVAEPAKPEAGPKVAVEAVEIDGSKIFVAGLADPGRRVRVYANDILLGEAVTSPDGHFLVETTRDIPVGEYTVRVDALDANGAKVAARATVPFEREPGEAMSAVASGAPEPLQTETKTADATPAAAVPAAGETPETAQPETAQLETAQPETAQPETAQPETAQPETTVPDETAVPETTAPKLQHADGAVIIRRGDSLWRISRRVYGRGIRYSTIYLANQKQISDPDMIWPGQVFTVPDKTKEGDAADLKALGDQATTVPAQ